MVNQLPLAFGFANLAILGWLAAAAAPILIHLWMRRVRKETRWAAVRFLQAAIKRHARRLQLQQWILLAIRTAIILLVVLAAAKPMFESLGLIGPGVRTHRLLVIDATMSMGYQAEDGALIERAKRLAGQLVDQSRAGDVFSVCTLAAPSRALFSQPTSDRSRVKQAIVGVELTEGSANLAGALTMVQHALGQAKSSGAKVDRTEVTFFTDMTATTWGSLSAGGATDEASEAERLYAKLIDRAVLSLVDVGEPGAANAAVVAVNVDDPAPTTQRPVAVRARIKRFDDKVVSPTVDLVVDGVTVQSSTVKLDESDNAPVEFSHKFREPGVHAVAVRIAEDKLPADDRRWAVCDAAEHVRVLCVEGRRGAAQYVASALNPAGSRDAAIQPDVASDASLATIDFDTYRCVFFCNVAQLSRAEAERLRNYVARGGGVVFFLGDRVAPRRYNELLGSWKAEEGKVPTLVAFDAHADVAGGLLPARIGAVVSEAQFRVDPLGYEHPIVAPFRGRERAGLINTPVAKYYKLKLPKESPGQVALATTGGDPLIATNSHGRGRVAVVATDGSLTSIDPATGEPWTAMPAWPSFLPIVRGLMTYAMGDTSGQTQLVGMPIGGLVPVGALNRELVIRRPSGDEEATIPQDNRPQDDGPEQSVASWAYDRTNQSGVYQLAVVNSPAPLEAVAVNPDPRESDLTRVAASVLPAELRLRSVDTESGGAQAELVEPTGVHRGLLLAALLLVLLETFLAFWFGRAAG